MKRKPVSAAVLAEAREEAEAVLAQLMARLAPGEHTVRLVVAMEGQEPLRATLPVTLEGDGGGEDLVSVEEKWFTNFQFLLTCGLAQTLCHGLMVLRSTGEDGQSVVRVWRLFWGVLDTCKAAEARGLVSVQEGPVTFLDAFDVHSPDEGDEELDGSPVAPASAAL